MVVVKAVLENMQMRETKFEEMKVVFKSGMSRKKQNRILIWIKSSFKMLIINNKINNYLDGVHKNYYIIKLKQGTL